MAEGASTHLAGRVAPPAGFFILETEEVHEVKEVKKKAAPNLYLIPVRGPPREFLLILYLVSLIDLPPLGL